MEIDKGNSFYILLVIAMLLPFQEGWGQSGSQQTYTIPKIDESISVDAYLDEPAWDQALRFDLDNEISPGENVKPPVETSALFLYSNTHLYVAFIAKVPDGEPVKGHLLDRDDLNNIGQEDIVGIRVDPFNDARRAFEFLVNPLGVQFDAIFKDQQSSEDFSWDAIWESNGRITNNGFITEMAIPFESIRFPRTEGVQTWRLAAGRVYPGEALHEIFHFKVDYDNSSFLEQVPQVTGIEGIEPGSSLNLTPTITARKNDTRPAPDQDIDGGRINIEPGATATWDVTSNLTVSGTVNPDFSQVEADAVRLEENARFVLSFPEKRPFFVEGSELFDTPMQAVFTRTVLEPIAGMKLAGKSGGNVLGTFATLDRENTLVFPRNQSSSRIIRDEDVWNTVFRYQRDVGSTGNVGLLYNGREANDYYNRVAGVDGFTRFWGSNSIEVQYLRSFTDYPSDLPARFNEPIGSFEGDAISAELNHNSLRWFGELSYEHISPNFRGDGGFFPRADFRTQEVSFGHIIREDVGGWFNQLRFRSGLERTTDFDGTLTDRELEFGINYNGPLRSTAFAEVSFTKRRFMGIEYDFTSISGLGKVSPSGSFTYDTFFSYGGAIDFTNNREARQLLVSPDITLRIGRHINLNLDPIFQKLSRIGGERIFSTWLLNSRILYYFNTKTFIRGLIRFRSTDRNTSAYTTPVASNEQSLFGQLLFNYKLNPESVFFFGVSHQFGDEPDRNDLQLINRTLFLKAGYVFQF